MADEKPKPDATPTPTPEERVKDVVRELPLTRSEKAEVLARLEKLEGSWREVEKRIAEVAAQIVAKRDEETKKLEKKTEPVDDWDTED